MAIIKKYSPFQNLTNYQTFLVDDNPNSDYFRITEFKETFTGGKNGFLIEGSPFLRETTEVKIEVLDVEGNPIYFEPGEGVPEYYEGLSKLVSIHIYSDTPIGIGKITILGELKQYVDSSGVTRNIPEEWKGVYNVKWEKEFKINKNLVNEDIVRFYKRPLIQIEELVKPIFSKTIPSVTDTVEVTGIPQNPPFNTDLSEWRAGTNYKLIRATGSWDRDVDENEISISSLNYTSNIIEVLNDREVLVDVPYTENNLVKAFESQSASVTYSDFQNEVIGESALTGSFAKIDMYQLKTFVGDVARVKIFRKSRNTAGDFQFVQESKLESTELLRDVTTQSDNEVSYGNFTETTLSNYWTTSSNDHTTTVNSSVLSQAVKVDYDNSSGGVQKLITSESFTLSKDVEYTLSFKTLLSGSATSNKYVKAYFSGSYTNNLGQPASYTQSFMHISGSSIYTTRQNVSQNILAERDISAKLVLEFSGSDWYVSNVSLRNAQETSFSPDEFTLIQDIPRKLPAETFDFRFEFYDINNNYIPVDVTAFKTFTGGNDFPTSGKLLTFESDRNAFRFSTGSIANPYNQTIQFKVSSNNLTGSVLFESQAFDVDGNYLDPSNYSQYPGLLTNVTTAGALLTLNNFTGSYSGGGTAPYIGSVVYTASLENLQEFETVYRLEDGDNAPQLIVTSNANQFIYEPTTLSPKPSGQSITIRAQRKNLASLITPITVNKSDSNAPNLTEGSTSNGVTSYTLSALEFSASFAANNFDEVTYSFTGSDVFGNTQTDEITLSKVVNFDAVSFRLSNPTHTFTADSTGLVTSDFSTGNGSVTMFVAGNQIQFDDNGSRNTFEITNLQGTGCTPIGGNGFDPTTNQYGITAMSLDSASLDVTITYTAGDNSTTQSFTENVTYTKARIAAPVISIETTNKDQSVSAFSTGEQVDSFENCIVTVKEQYGGSTTTKPITSLSATSSDISSISTTPSTGTITLNGRTLADGTNKTTVAVSATITDSEGTSRTVTDTISLSKVKKAQPSITFAANPESQTVTATSTGTLLGTIQDVTISGFEGSTALTYNQGTLSDSQYKITNVTGVTVSDTTPSTSTIDITTFSGDEVTGTATIAYVDSEGTSGTATKQFSLSKSKKAPPGVVATLNRQSQTVESNTAFTSVGTPQDVTLIVNEGGTNYTYTTGTVGSNQFKITGVTGGTNNNDGTITPDTPTDATGTSGVITYSYTNSEGTAFTSKTINFNVGVSIQGEPGVGAFSIEVNPPSQDVVIDIQDNITSPDDFSVQVFDSSGSYAYSATLASDATFKVTNLSQTNTSGTPSNSSGTITPATPSSANGSNVTFDVTVKDRDGTTSSAVSKTHKIVVIADGSTGPGIVFTGVWDTDRIYQYDLQNGRRDAVLWSTDGNPPYESYYATLQQAGTSVDSPDITTGSYWEYLGDQDFFVAAKISIFEESYVQNTLNIGTTSNTISAANITLWGADTYPYFSLGQSATVGTQEFGANGIFIGRHTTAKNSDADNGAYVLSLVNGTDSWLKWDGDSLNIKGSITITGGNAATTGYVDQAESDAVSTASSDATSKANAAEAAAIAVADSIADGTYSGGTYIDGTSIISPIIAGNTGYFSGKVTVGNSNSIVLDATTATRRIYVGTGTFNNSNTSVYLDGGGQFSLKDKLSWDGTTLAISGNITANSLTLGAGVTVPSGNVSGLGDLAALDDITLSYVTDAGGLAALSSVSDSEIDDNAVTSAKIIANAVSAAKIATNAVTEGKISANAVVADKIAANAIVSDKIAANAITAGKINAGAIEADKIAAGAVTAAKISAGAVEADKIAANAVTADKILANTITATKISSLSFSGKTAVFDTGTVGGWTMSSTKLYNSGVSLSTDDGGDKGLFIDNASSNEAVSVHDGTSFRNTTSTSAFSAWSDPGNSQSVSGAIFGQNTPSTAGYTFYSAFTGNISVSGDGVIGITSSEIDSLISQTPGSYWLDRGTVTFVQTYHWLYLQVYNSSNVLQGERLIGSGYVNYDGGYDKSISNLGTASIVLSTGTYKARIKHLIGVNYLASGDSVTLHDAYYGGANAVYATSGAGRSTELCQIGLKTTYGINDFTVNTSTGGSVNLLNVDGSSVFTGPATFTGIDASVIDVDSLTVGEISLRGGVLTVNGDIRATGDIYALSSSDKRLKTNINPITNPIDIIKKLNGYTFNWNEISKKSQDKEEIGVIAQEVQEVLPQIVGDKGKGFLGVDYDKIVAVLIEGMKAQQTQIENLQNEIVELKKSIK